MTKEQTKRIYLASPRMSDEGYELEYIHEAFETNWVAPLGPNVNAFEEEFANYLKTEKAAALSSGTSAIHLALKHLGVGNNFKPGDSLSDHDDVVLVSTLTFSATVNPIVYERAMPVLIDSDLDSWNMDPAALEIALKKYGSRVKAVVVVHLYGLSAKTDQILALCDQHKVPLIEDAAESLGANVQTRYYADAQEARSWHDESVWVPTGTMGVLGCYSFNGNKIITTSGGGMLVANDPKNAEEFIDKTHFWSTQSRDPAPWYQHSELGFNYRMSNICAGIGRGQLKVIDKHIAKKKSIFDRYSKAFAPFSDSVQMMPVQDWNKPNYWLSCCLFHDENMPQRVYEKLLANNIDSRPIWKPMHLQPYYEKCDFVTSKEKGSYSEDLFRYGICLPSDINMTEEEQDRAIALIISLIRGVE